MLFMSIACVFLTINVSLDKAIQWLSYVMVFKTSLMLLDASLNERKLHCPTFNK